ncbi:mannosylglycoprotein endo-beta-mannosidase isoform X2 [Henckelia pumila]|uniref:mannosylglycoprotein endo-beta-mannosidase isoform X2 n=1 Tax=Henckelia pumila TaxID=405737 RepID=UPI003C6E5435
MAEEVIGKRVLDGGWLAARSTEVDLTGVDLTTTHPPSAQQSSWMEAVVPGTVLATLVKNNLVRDPFYGLENETIIDIGESGREYYTFWFFTTFECKLSTNQHVDLNFRAINYSADVYLNGHKVVLPKGMFRRHCIDVTDILNPDGKNLLAVLVYPPDHPGKIPPEGGQGGDHEIGKDVAAQYVEGWDWMTPIRDRNTGIWDEVSLCITGLFFYKPNLWWPNGMGKQSLYNVEITVDVESFGESDSWSHHFGFRKIESNIDSATGGRLFKVNGQPIFIRGGNWILSDGLLRLSKRRYKTDIKFHAEMNFNMMRCWGGGLAERPEFYHYCDIYGLLVWQEFWITGDCDGRGIPVSNPDGPLDHDLFLLCATDTVKLLRNHPSLALWVGGNEQVPPDDINTALKKDLQLHPYFESSTDLKFSKEDIYPVSKDPGEYLDGTRIYVQGSMWDGFANGEGDFTDGPYEIQNPENFFKDDFYNYGFNPEVGSVGMPVAATIRATLPREGWQIPLFNKLDNGYVEEVPNPIWDYHKYIPYSKPGLVHDQILLYGTPTDIDDFCLKAQLVNYIQYRALLEGWTSRMWSKYTGVLIWKTQNPWTGLRGQFYDHLHEQTAGFYGCRCAAEPIHVQLNLATNYLEVVNTTSKELSDVAIESSVWDLEGACLDYEVLEKLTIPSKKTVSISEMKYPKSDNPKPVYFLLLKLYKREDYRLLSRNFYWLHLTGGDYKLLEPYKKNKVSLKITSMTYIRGSSYEVRMHVENTSKKPDSRTLLHNNVLEKNRLGDSDMQSEGVHCVPGREHERGLLEKVLQYFSTNTSGVKVTEVNGAGIGVAFFLHFSVHASNKDNKEGEDTRILPVHYSDNYFSMVPGEVMAITLNFDVPPGVTPRITLHGWNYEGGHTVL